VIRQALGGPSSTASGFLLELIFGWLEAFGLSADVDAQVEGPSQDGLRFFRKEGEFGSEEGEDLVREA